MVIVSSDVKVHLHLQLIGQSSRTDEVLAVIEICNCISDAISGNCITRGAISLEHVAKCVTFSVFATLQLPCMLSCYAIILLHI